MHDDPQRGGELTGAARALLARPWRTVEADRPLFLLIRRHAEQLDRWFTQRLGYRLVVGTDTARLVKSGHIPADRPLRTPTQRPVHCARVHPARARACGHGGGAGSDGACATWCCTVRSAAADAGIALDGATSERRALVTALRWLVEYGVVRELDRSVTGYESTPRPTLCSRSQ